MSYLYFWRSSRQNVVIFCRHSCQRLCKAT